MISIGKMRLSKKWSLVARGSHVLGEDRPKYLITMVKCYRCSDGGLCKKPRGGPVD